MDSQEAQRLFAEAMNKEAEALRSHHKERKGLPGWERYQQAKAHTEVMRRQLVRILAGIDEPNEEETA